MTGLLAASHWVYPWASRQPRRNRREKLHKMRLRFHPLRAGAEKSRNERGSRRLVLETSWADGLQNGARRDAVHALRPDRIRAMLIRPHRLAVVVLAIFCSSRLAHSGESDAARGAAILQQTRTITEAEFNQSLRQSGSLTVHAASKTFEGTYTHASDGALSRDEVVLPAYTEVRVRTGTQEKVQRPGDHDPLAIYAAFDAVRPINWLQLLPDERIKKKTRKLENCQRAVSRSRANTRTVPCASTAMAH